jgi:hypothetical protein
LPSRGAAGAIGKIEILYVEDARHSRRT